NVIVFLLFQGSNPNDDLGAGMIEGDQQSSAPWQNFAGVLAYLVIVWLDRFQRVEGDRSERSDDRRVDQLDQTTQKTGAITDFCPGGLIIRSGWFARTTED